MKYTSAQYAFVLRDMVKESPRQTRKAVRGLVELLERHHALSLWTEIAREYVRAKTGARGRKPLTVRLEKRGGGTAIRRGLPFPTALSIVKDARLRGGVVLETEDLRIDNSIMGRLKRMREALTG